MLFLDCIWLCEIILVISVLVIKLLTLGLIFTVLFFFFLEQLFTVLTWTCLYLQLIFTGVENLKVSGAQWM